MTGGPEGATMGTLALRPGRSAPRSALGLGGFLALALALAALGLYATTPAASSWLTAMQVPWSPPMWALRATWLALDVGTGIAGWLVWRERGRRTAVDGVLLLYGLAAVLHASWLMGFLLAAGQPGPHLWLVLVVLLLLDLTTLALACASWSISRPAGVLLFASLSGLLGGTALALGDTLLALAT